MSLATALALLVSVFTLLAVGRVYAKLRPTRAPCTRCGCLAAGLRGSVAVPARGIHW